jgi:2-aminoadipate transaminase
MNMPSSGEIDAAAPRRAFAHWLGTTNDVTHRFLAAGRIPGLTNMAGGLPAPEQGKRMRSAGSAHRAP